MNFPNQPDKGQGLVPVDMKIVFLTRKCEQGVILLSYLKNSGIPLEAVFIEKSRIYENIRKGKKFLKLIGLPGVIKAVCKRFKRRLIISTSSRNFFQNDFYRSYADRVYVVDDFNGNDCERLLKEIRPDIIILGGTGIIRRHIIEIPGIGILNAHPGLLPDYRGNDVVAWAVYNGDTPGATIYFIDEGVDTGDIVARGTIKIDSGDTLIDLEKKCMCLMGDLMVETVGKINKGEKLKVIPQVKEEGKQYYKMPGKLFRETMKKLITGTGPYS